jgi:hypothetical protein
MFTNKLFMLAAVAALMLAGIPMGADNSYPAGGNVTGQRTLDKTVQDGIDSITGTLTITNSAAQNLNGLFISEHMPTSVTLRTVSVKVNGSTVSNYDYSASSAGLIFTNLISHTWVLELPSEYGTRNPVNSGGSAVEIQYVIKSSQEGTVSLEGYSWAGKLGVKNGAATNAVFGYNTPADITVIAPPATFSDDFNDGNYSGWTVGEGSWAVESGKLNNTSSSGFSSIWAGQSIWTDITITADITLETGTDSWIIFRVQDQDNYYIFTLQDGGALWLLQNRGGPKLADAVGGSFSSGNTYTIKVVLEGNSIKIYHGATKLIDLTDNTFSSGYVGFGANGALGAFDNVSVSDNVTVEEEITRQKTPVVNGISAYPNPFRPTTLIYLNGAIPEKSPANLVVYDVKGREVADLTPGLHRSASRIGNAALWDATGIPSGLYVAVLKVGKKRFEQKLILAK